MFYNYYYLLLLIIYYLLLFLLYLCLFFTIYFVFHLFIINMNKGEPLRVRLLDRQSPLPLGAWHAAGPRIKMKTNNIKKRIYTNNKTIQKQ